METYDLGYDFEPSTEATTVAQNSTALLTSFVYTQTGIVDCSGLDVELKTFCNKIKNGSVIFELYDSFVTRDDKLMSDAAIFLKTSRASLAKSISFSEPDEAKEEINSIVALGRRNFLKSKASFSIEKVFKSFLKFQRANRRLRRNEFAYIQDSDGKLIIERPKEVFKLDLLIDPILSKDVEYKVLRLRIKQPDFSGDADWVFISETGHINALLNNVNFFEDFLQERLTIHPSDILTALVCIKTIHMTNGKTRITRTIDSVIGIMSIKTGEYNEFDRRYIDSKSEEILAAMP